VAKEKLFTATADDIQGHEARLEVGAVAPGQKLAGEKGPENATCGRDDHQTILDPPDRDK